MCIRDRSLIDQISQAFNELDALYIADGHHRAAAASRVGQEADPHSTRRQFLAVTFPHNQLQLLPYNRAVLTLNGLSPDALLTAISARFTCTRLPEATPPSSPRSWSMYLNRQWYQLEPTPALQAVINNKPLTAQLDVSVLQDEILRPFLNVEDPRTCDHILFVGGIRGLSELEKHADQHQGVSFALYPTSVDELMDIADQGEVMPPKSTWFEPKLRSGLLISTFK